MMDLLSMHVLAARYLLLNLFTGVIVEVMLQIKLEVEEKEREAKAWAAAKKIQTGGRPGGAPFPLSLSLPPSPSLPPVLRCIRLSLSLLLF